MKYYKLETYVPEAFVESVKEALALAGAGKFGDYDHCFWQSSGLGEFRPLESSNPFIGKAGGEVEHVREIKIETICSADNRKAVVAALKEAHPYECCAYYLFPVEVLSPEETEEL